MSVGVKTLVDVDDLILVLEMEEEIGENPNVKLLLEVCGVVVLETLWVCI